MNNSNVDIKWGKKNLKLLEVYIDPEVNSFQLEEYVEKDLPSFDKSLIPEPIFQENKEFVDLYYKSFELAFNNFKKPTKENGFIKNYVDTAFNDSVFLWDSVFIAMYGKYVSDVFNFQETLDNFYVIQEPDGFIGREVIRETGNSKFHRFDPVSTGPNILAFAEWRYYLYSHDLERLMKVYPVILRYHRWLKRYCTFRDGSYWYTGWSCGMDNQLRVSEEKFDYSYHDNQSWIDANIHQLMSCVYLEKIAKETGIDIPEEIEEEKKFLSSFINDRMWDEESGFYYDLKSDSSLSEVKTLGVYWTLHTDLLDKVRKEKLIDKLFDKNWFYSKYPFATIARSDKNYNPMGEYWRGGVWAPTNYMIFTGLDQKVESARLYETALIHLNQINDVYKATGTVWENYAPEFPINGEPSKPNFMGWTGLSTIALFIEFIIGIKIDTTENTIRWNLNSLEECGINNLVFGNQGKVSLLVEKRNNIAEKPIVNIETEIKNLNLEIYINDKKVDYERVE